MASTSAWVLTAALFSVVQGQCPFTDCVEIYGDDDNMDVIMLWCQEPYSVITQDLMYEWEVCYPLCEIFLESSCTSDAINALCDKQQVFGCGPPECGDWIHPLTCGSEEYQYYMDVCAEFLTYMEQVPNTSCVERGKLLDWMGNLVITPATQITPIGRPHITRTDTAKSLQEHCFFTDCIAIDGDDDIMGVSMLQCQEYYRVIVNDLVNEWDVCYPLCEIFSFGSCLSDEIDALCDKQEVFGCAPPKCGNWIHPLTCGSEAYRYYMEVCLEFLTYMEQDPTISCVEKGTLTDGMGHIIITPATEHIIVGKPYNTITDTAKTPPVKWRREKRKRCTGEETNLPTVLLWLSGVFLGALLVIILRRPRKTHTYTKTTHHPVHR
jgi:hypothetical protein